MGIEGLAERGESDDALVISAANEAFKIADDC